MDPVKPERSSTWDSGYDTTVADETRRHRHYRSSGVFNVFSAPAPLIVEPEIGNKRTSEENSIFRYDTDRQELSPSPQPNEDDDVHVYSYRPPLVVDLNGPRHIALRKIKEEFSKPPNHAQRVVSYRETQYQQQVPLQLNMHSQQYEGPVPVGVPVMTPRAAPNPILRDVAGQRPILRHKRGQHQLATHPIDIKNIMQEQQPEPSHQASFEETAVQTNAEGSKPSSIAASVNTNIAPRSSQAQAIPLRDVDKRMIFPCPLAPNKWFHIKFRCNAGTQGEIHRPFDYDLYHDCLVPNAAVIHLGRPCTCIRADTPLPETTSIKTSTSRQSKIDMTAESTVIKGQTKAEVSMRSGDAFLSTMMGGIELEPKSKKEKKEKPKDSAKRRGSFLSKLIH